MVKGLKKTVKKDSLPRLLNGSVEKKIKGKPFIHNKGKQYLNRNEKLKKAGGAQVK